MPSSQYINREVSWLEFNQRVLGQAQDSHLPLLERLKFLAISGSNLDEFCQVRVGGLVGQKVSGSRARGIAGLTPSQQLELIHKRMGQMSREQYQLFSELLPLLAKHRIFISQPGQLSDKLQKVFRKRFNDNIAPLLTPIALADDTPQPFIKSLQLNLIVELALADEKRFLLLPIPEMLERFVVHIDEDGTHVLTIEDLIAEHLAILFPEESVVSTAAFRLTRNADIILEDEDAADLAKEMNQVLSQRKLGLPVRLEVQANSSRVLATKIKSLLEGKPYQSLSPKGPLAVSDFMTLAFMPGHDDLKVEDWQPQPSPLIDPTDSMFDNISRGNILLHHPYDSFDPVVRFIKEASTDSQTLAIKQVLYRTANNSKIIDALIQAAQNGKQVTVLVELKARFDEANNLLRADELQKAGVQIVYGVKLLKTHAKIAMIIRNEGGSLVRYLHLGTGNYNESTAKIYTDISYLTKDKKYGADASSFFNAVTGRSQVTRFHKLAPAPTHMKKLLLQLIDSETQRAKRGEKALIMAKVNSLQDKEIIDALYKASAAGVTIQLCVRGVCCLKPSNRKEAANIRVISIIDRYLEHSRICYFHQGGDPKVYISSADWMTRNLDKRVELMIPIESPADTKRLTTILESAFRDNQNAHLILPDGSSTKIETKEKNFRLQQKEQKRSEQAYADLKFRQTTTFEPHTPKDK